MPLTHSVQVKVSCLSSASAHRMTQESQTCTDIFVNELSRRSHLPFSSNDHDPRAISVAFFSLDVLFSAAGLYSPSLSLTLSPGGHFQHSKALQ